MSIIDSRQSYQLNGFSILHLKLCTHEYNNSKDVH